LSFPAGSDRLLSKDRHEDAGQVKVRVRTLDALADELGLQDAVLKLDCEGYEYDVFETALPETLLRFHEICVELHDTKKNGAGVAAIRNKLVSAGFRCEFRSNRVFRPNWLLYARRPG